MPRMRRYWRRRDTVLLSLVLVSGCGFVSNLLRLGQEDRYHNVLTDHLYTVHDNTTQNITSKHFLLNETEWRKFSTVTKLVYNRVPKCGSMTMLHLIKTMRRRNNFSYVHSAVTDQQKLSRSQQQAVISSQMRRGTKQFALYDRHIYFLNYTEYGYSMPVYFNLIRDPLTRFTSAYYYFRSPNKRHLYTEEEYSKTINQCIESNVSCKGCMDSDMFAVIPYFCGHENFCTQPTYKALNRAMYNVRKHFPVVGINEDYISSLQLLECTFPQFFRGVIKFYKSKRITINKSVHKEEITTNNRHKLLRKTHFILEYQFYEFVKSRLYSMKNQLKDVCKL